MDRFLQIIAGRPRDLEDVRTILLKKFPMDAGYLRQWLKELSPVSEGMDFINILAEIYKELPGGR